MPAAKLTAAYAAFGAAWILCSDKLLLAMAPDKEILSVVGVWKGFAFVACSSALIYGLARRGRPRREPAPLTGRRAVPVLWLAAAVGAVVLLSGLAGVFKAARDTRADMVEKLRVVVELKAEMAASWMAERQIDGSALDNLQLHAVQGLWRRRHRDADRPPFQTVLFREEGGSILFVSDIGRAPGRISQSDPETTGTVPAMVLRDGLVGRDFEGAWVDREPMLAFALPVPGTQWYAAAQVGKKDLYARVGADAARVALVDTAALLAAMLALHGIWQRRELQAARRQQAEQQEKLRALQLLDAMANGSGDAIYAKDMQGRYLFANGEVCRLLGRPLEALVGRQDKDFFSPQVAARLRAEDDEVIAAGEAMDSQGWIDAVDGERFYFNSKAPLRDAEGRVVGIFGLSRDVTERKREEDTLRQWAMAFESIQDGVMITDPQGNICAVNRAFTGITGFTAAEVMGRSPRLLQSGRHDQAFYGAIWSAVMEEGRWQGEVWSRRRNGEVYPEWLTISAVRDGQGQLVNYVGVFTDISRIKNSERQLERLASYDSLTQLPNRCFLNERLESVLERGRGQGRRVAVLFIDLDGFKTVNDSLGHPAGDELLVRIAGRLKACMRDGHLLGRLGGDEFLVVMEDAKGEGDAASLAQALIDAVATPVTLAAGRDAYVTASIGIALHGEGGAVELLRDSDAAMYRAKAEGRNRYCFYTSDLNTEAVSKLELEAALSRALQRDELLLHFQRKVDARSGKIVGVEALLRWRRQGGRLVPPGQFIPVAERGSLILDIGAWVVDAACRQVREWLDAGLPVPRVAVNVAAHQFAAGDLDAVVARALDRHRVPAKYLEIELTESMLMDRPEQTAAMLRRLKALGLALSLDDFGTGYSSLGYLQRFPIDALKIDQSFVSTIGSGPDGSALADAIIALAHRLGLHVIAEGVETEAQREHLARQGCDEMQGFHFGAPEPAQALRLALERDIV